MHPNFDNYGFQESMRPNVLYLYGIAFNHMSMGRGPEVYLLIIRGRIIWIGTMGTPNRASFSLGTPSSISFKPVTASAAAKPICNINYHNLLFIMTCESQCVTQIK